MTERAIVIRVNSGPKMSRGKYAAQAVHAALHLLNVHPGVPVIVLGGSRAQIAASTHTVRDAGRTEVEPGTMTAGASWRGTPPSPVRRRLRRILVAALHPEPRPSPETEHVAPREAATVPRLSNWDTGEPGATFIQWKGTKVCMDLLCPACGAGGHIDAEFAYLLRCEACDAVVEVGTSVALRAMSGDEVVVAGPRRQIPFRDPTEGEIPT